MMIMFRKSDCRKVMNKMQNDNFKILINKATVIYDDFYKDKKVIRVIIPVENQGSISALQKRIVVNADGTIDIEDKLLVESTLSKSNTLDEMLEKSRVSTDELEKIIKSRFDKALQKIQKDTLEEANEITGKVLAKIFILNTMKFNKSKRS